MGLLSNILGPAAVADDTLVGVQRRVRIITIGTLAMFVIGFVSIVQFWTLGLPEMCVALTFTMLGCAGNLWVLRRTRQPGLCGNVAVSLLYSLLLFSNAISGGFGNPNFGWFYTVPVAAACLVDLRSGFAWAAIVVATSVGFWWAPLAGIEIPNLIPPDLADAHALFNRVTTVVGLTILSTSFVAGQRRAEIGLVGANDGLRREAALVQLLQQTAVAANEALTFEDALEASMEQVCKTTGWPLGHVCLPVEDGSGKLEPSGIWVVTPPDTFAAFREVTARTTFLPDGDFTGGVFTRGEPAWITESDVGDSEEPRVLAARSCGLTAGIAFPVLARGEVVAVLEFFANREIEPDPRMLEVLGLVGRQIGRVAERIELQERLRQSQKMEAVGQLAAGIAHEINNPMAYVRSNLGILRSEWEALREEIDKAPGLADAQERLGEFEELIDDSMEGVDRTVAIVRDVKEFSHAGSGGRENADLSELVESAMRVALARKPIDIEIEREYGDAPAISCYPSQLRQVFLNLIVNAIQALGESGHVAVSTGVRDDHVWMRVEDDGPGIDEASMGRLFDPFFTTKPAGEGTGLGLYISYEIVRTHGGEIRVDSRVGSGSTFEVRLPLAPDPH